jgi:hypothetical protein
VAAPGSLTDFEKRFVMESSSLLPLILSIRS